MTKIIMGVRRLFSRGGKKHTICLCLKKHPKDTIFPRGGGMGPLLPYPANANEKNWKPGYGLSQFVSE